MRRRSAATAVVFVLAGLGFVVAMPAVAATYGLQTQLFMDGRDGPNAPFQVGNTGLVPSTTPLTLNFSFSSNTAVDGFSTASGTATSFYGFLDASGSASTAPGVNKGGTEARVTPDVAGAPDAFFEDQITVGSSTLANGTPVILDFLLHASGTATAISGGDELASAEMHTEFQLLDFNREANPGSNFDIIYGLGTYDQVVSIQAEVGDVLGIHGSLFADGNAPDFDGLGPASFSYSDPASLHILAVTPDLDLVSASGHDYSPGGVPEPAAWALMLAGFAGVGVALRRRRTQVA